MSTTTTGTQTFAIDASHTTVEFVVRHLMISKVRGRFTKVEGTIGVAEGSEAPASIDVTIDASTIDTREDQRDGHLRSPDFLDTAQYPNITFRSKSVDGSGTEFRVHGDLTLHGVTREVVLHATFEGRVTDPWGNARIGYSAHTTISRKEYGLVWNQALEAGGVAVSDDVRIELNVEAVAVK